MHGRPAAGGHVAAGESALQSWTHGPATTSRSVYFALGFFQGALLKDSKKLLVQLGQVQAGHRLFDSSYAGRLPPPMLTQQPTVAARGQ